MPYVIRNCPCYVEGIAIKGDEQKTQTCNNHKLRELTYCADITDCKLKQIYDLCNKYKEHDIIALQITNLLDIQEVE